MQLFSICRVYQHVVFPQKWPNVGLGKHLFYLASEEIEMSRWLGVACLVLAVFASAAVDLAVAQPGRGGQGGGQGGGRGGMAGMMGGAGGSAMLLMNEKVREQLELSKDQIQRLEDLQADMRDEMQEMFRGGGGGGGDAREKIQEVMGRIQKEIDGVLLKHQREQLSAMTASMTMQRGGATGVLNDPNLIKQLGLSDSEAKKFREQAAEMQAKQEEEIAKLRERYNERIIALLPKEAQEKMKEWMKTEVPEFNFGGRGGRGEGGQGGRGEQGRGQRPLDF
ncbi:MAG: hypothetical protein Q8M16_04340 [Pirellulaceae bacterium]|nr:hypothetical protein [Pirellulaceae bacterium]